MTTFINAIRNIRVKLPFRAAYILFIVVTLSACGGGGSDTVVEPPTSEAPPTTPAPTPEAVSEEQLKDASRLLTQTTFGASFDDIEATAEYINEHSIEEWIDAQQSLPITLHYPVAFELASDIQDQPGAFGRPYRMDAWFRASLFAEDQLRQRVAFALSQLFVISENSQLNNFQVELANWYDQLLRNAFGNYRDLMEEVTLSPVMGLYLSMMSNEKPQPELNIRPDENFSRELMQLFALGLYELNQDGSYVLDSNSQPIPSYDQALIEAYAHVFTGWHFAGKNENNWDRFFQGADFISPMELVDAYHDEGEKILLDGEIIPAGTDGQIALNIALDTIFAHPNVGPFVAQHLIKHLITSNPSADYISRVSAVFNDNGDGIRGDLAAVIKAILTDDEARKESFYTQATYGRVKQPLVKALQVMRSIIPQEQTLSNSQRVFAEFARIQDLTAQAPLGAPSVFGFFLPDHQPIGEFTALGLIAPEMQMATSNNIVRNSNFSAYLLYSNQLNSFRERLQIDLNEHAALLSEDLDTFLNHVNYQLMQGQMSEDFRQVLVDFDASIRDSVSTEDRTRELLNLIFISPQFAVQF